VAGERRRRRAEVLLELVLLRGQGCQLLPGEDGCVLLRGKVDLGLAEFLIMLKKKKKREGEKESSNELARRRMKRRRRRRRQSSLFFTLQVILPSSAKASRERWIAGFLMPNCASMSATP
jgi:hypothetical protein